MTITLNGTTGIQNVLGSAASPAESNTTNSNTGVYFPTSTSVGFSANGAVALSVDASNNIFYAGGTERARVDSSGSLLVGTSAASNTNGVQITKGGAAGGGVIVIYKTASGATNAILNYYGTNYVGGINYDNTSTSLATSSDIRLKKDVVDAPSAIDVTTSIRVVSHSWKHDEATVRYGFVAQELINVAPEAVMQGDNGEEIETTWTVDYARLVPMLVKSIQEQQALITQLTDRIAALEAK
jgi:hypothetical protein